MDLLIAFVVFISSVVFVLVKNLPMSLAMSAGFVCFFIVGVHRKFRVKSLLLMSLTGAKNSLIVVHVLLTIGILTGLWRSAGTFAILTAWGLRVISPSMFILASFVLSCLLSYALGTSFGTAGTLGIALMTLSRSGNVNPIITAGAIMSGIHFGDRGSPSSSCVHLVTALTHTELYSNVKAMMKTALIPLAISLAFYFFLSLRNPLINFNNDMLEELSSAFNLNPLVISPTVIMLMLPLFKVNIFITFLISIISAFLCTIFIQNCNCLEALKFALIGLHSDDGIKILFNGGGLISMVQTCLVLIISGTFAGIFDGTRMLEDLQGKISRLIKKFGAFPVTLSVGIIANSIFCNQTVGILMTNQLISKPYQDNSIRKNQLALDIANSTVITAPLIPNCIACSVPLGMMGAGLNSISYACYLYLIPLCYILTRKIFTQKS